MVVIRCLLWETSLHLLAKIRLKLVVKGICLSELGNVFLGGSSSSCGRGATCSGGVCGYNLIKISLDKEFLPFEASRRLVLDFVSLPLKGVIVVLLKQIVYCSWIFKVRNLHHILRQSIRLQAADQVEINCSTINSL